MKIQYLISLLVLSTLSAFSPAVAQGNGTARGKVVDGNTGEALLGATVRFLQGESVKGGAYTDLDGAYSVELPGGSYEIVVSYISYLNDTLAIEVAQGQVTYSDHLLTEETAVREDLAVDITAKRSNASEVTLYNVKRNSINTLDGITLDQVRRAGDANVAAAMQRVVGVTVEGGKYVYVRGLGDRYSKTLLNGAEIPSLDPNRNSVQLDIFPSSLIDNILTYKNFTPDLPGSFSGGLVNVQTKDFPDRFSLRVSTSLGVNTQASFNDNFLADQQYEGDALGYSNEIRDMPQVIADQENNRIPQNFPSTAAQLEAEGPLLEDVVRSFRTDFLPVRRRSGLNQNHSITVGNQHQLFGRPFGYIASFSFRRTFDYFENGIANQWDLPSQTSQRLNPIANFRGDRGEDNTLWGGLIKLSYKPSANHKFSVNVMQNQNSTSYGEVYQGPYFSSGGDIILQTRTTGYIERAIQVYQGQGDHAFGSAFEADWIVSYSNASQYEPDLRFFANEIDTAGGMTNFVIQAGNGYDLPLRFYRDLEEQNLDARLNLKVKFPGINSSRLGNVKFGGAFTQKERDFSEFRYQIIEGPDASSLDELGGDIDAYLGESNLLTLPRLEDGTLNIPARFVGIYYLDNTLDANIFRADQDIFAAYAMGELPIGDRLQVVGGLRYEGTRSVILPSDSTIFDAIRRDDSTATPGELNLDDFLPALNFVYSINEDMKIRAGYSRTLARPTVVEISPFEQVIGIGQPVRVGNPLLERTLIDNFDLRWEWYFSLTENVSVSAFYKNFQNPIELAQDFSTQNLRFQYVNRDSAFIGGLEFEFKKNFGFISPKLEKLVFGGNASFIYSEAALTEDEILNIQAVDSTRSTTRPLFGQSPYVFNAELAYIDKDELGLQVAANLNVFGPRIAVAGGAAPDIYEQPRPSLNLSVTKEIGDYLQVRLRANNLLNPEYKFTQDFRGDEFIFRSNPIGRTFSLGLTFKIN